MKLLTLIFILCLSANLFAKSTLKAHNHDGVLKTKLVVEEDGKSLAIEMESSGDSLLGFETKPKSKFQKAVYQAVKNIWENKLSSLIIFDKASACRINETSFNMEFETHEEEHSHHHKKAHKHEENHSEILAKANIACTKSVSGSEASIKMKSIFNKTIRSLYEQNKKKRHHFVGNVKLEVIPAKGKPFVKTSKSSSFKVNL